jgi:hypothetical protein
VYQSEAQFARAIVNGTPPTLLVYGGKRTNLREADIEDVLPFAFLYGSGGPKTKRRVNVSLDACIKRYFRTAMPQFMQSEVVLVLEHMFARHISYKTGIVKLRSNIGGQKVGNILGNCTVEDFKKILENEEDNSLSEPVKQLMKSISTTCQALGHTEDAAKFARRCHYATSVTLKIQVYRANPGSRQRNATPELHGIHDSGNQLTRVIHDRITN